MKDFRISQLTTSSVLYMYSMRDIILFTPPYQRMGDVWPKEKRQLLIDSLLNGYDIPKLYFHEFFPSKNIGGKQYKYAIVDGKQRLQSIFEFIDGKLQLGDEHEYIHDSTVDYSGLTYAELGRKYPELKTRFDGTVLPIISIQTEDLELIEEMFSRLNEAVPLNAAEKRNAFGGPLPPVIRDLAAHAFFKECVPFKNTRYRHYDLATKFLYIEHKEGLADTKKVYLDEFVRDFSSTSAAKQLQASAKKVLSKMHEVFDGNDVLLSSIGMVVLYYFLFRDALENKWVSAIDRDDIEEFEAARGQNRLEAEIDVTQAVYSLLEFDRLSQSPNDAVALRYRYAVLRNRIGPAKGRPKIPGET